MDERRVTIELSMQELQDIAVALGMRLSALSDARSHQLRMSAGVAAERVASLSARIEAGESPAADVRRLPRAEGALR